MGLATVREWYDDLGWGVLDCPETPGGCWVLYSTIESLAKVGPDGTMSTYKELTVGETVELDWEAPGQDGFDYRAVTVRRSAP
jgi:CspA family cold shock protein